MIGGRRVKGLLLAGALALGSLGAGCGPGIYETYAYKNEYDPRKHEYVIGPSDSISVQVYHQSDLSGSGTVRPDGVITLPLIGDVIVAGKTPSQVREIVKQKLSQYVKADTAITVTVTGFNSYRFVVSGNVNKAGSFSQKYYVTVSEAIAMAGGLNKFAGDQIVILRQSKEGPMREIPISYKRITSGKRPDMDICLVNGDTLIVD
jgi:polysaccharide biosynthesis/export protein